MDYEKIFESINRAIESRPLDHGAYADLFSLVRTWETADFARAHEINKQLRGKVASKLREVSSKEAVFFYDQWRKCLLFDAPHDFDSFMLYIELDRKPDKRFYAPRRHYLRPMVQGFQDILDGKLRLLTISMPKRAGKSQTGINFVNMLSGKYPDRSTLMEGTGDDLVKSFYSGCLEYLQTPNEYLFYDVFPEAKLVQTNADTKTINLRAKARFPTVMCRSIDARQVGLSEATNVLYLDDCVEGREEAKNRQRLDDKWEVISGDIMGRAIEGTPMVFTGTRYSIYDPIGRIQEHAQREGWGWRAIEIPALDPVTDESNYEYEREGTADHYYEIDSSWKILKNEEQIFGIPIIEYPLNNARLGAFEIVLPLLDAINTVDSNRLDGVEQFIQALLLFHNVDISSPDYANLRAEGAIKFRDIDQNLKADIEYLTAELNQSQTETLIDHLYDTVLTICGMPNRNGGSSTSDTGSAVIMRDGWSSAEARAKDTELMFKLSEKDFLKKVLRICQDLSDMELRLSEVEVRFTRRNYENIVEKANVLTTLLNNPKIAPQLAFTHCGMFSDPQLAYAKQSNMGTLSGLNVVQQQENPVNELDFQVAAKIQKVNRDIEYTFINGVYNKATSDATANKTRGLIPAITTNVTAMKSKPLGLWDIAGMVKKIYGANAPTDGLVLWCDAITLFQINADAVQNGLTVVPAAREINGISLSSVVTPIGVVYLYLGECLPAGTALLLNLNVLAPVYQPVPGKGNFFLEPLAKTGAGEKYQLFGQIGLDHGPEWYHGKFTGISTAFEAPKYSRSVFVSNAADFKSGT